MLDDQSMDLLFRKARSQNGWQSRPVSDDELRRLYELIKWGPTSANCSPARFLFLRTPEAKERIKPALSKSNQEKAMTAPVLAVVAYDTRFYELLPRLFPHNQSARTWFEGEDKKALAEANAIRNGSLQGAYMMIAARACGLDCGPMSGFDNARVDEEFFKGTSVRSNFICGIGHGDPSKVFARNPRLAFDEACTLL